MSKNAAFDHPYDTPLTSGLRFLAELIEWTAYAWIASQVSIWLAILVLIVLIGLPTVFSTPGDKKQYIVATPGPLRGLLEHAIHLIGVICVWIIWPTWMAFIASIIVIAAVLIGLPRTRWLFRGAPGTLEEKSES